MASEPRANVPIANDASPNDAARLSRRRFLRRTGGAAVAIVTAPYYVRAGALGAPGKPGPNDRVGIGYIGVGRRAQQLMSLPKDTVVTAVADVHRGRAGQVAEKLKCAAYSDYRALLESKDVDAVIVATPDHWHTLPSIHACQAGKDVYCEKPLTLTIREGRILVNAVRKYARVFQTGSQQRSMAPNRVACELIRNGRIGTVHTVIGNNYPSPWECALPSQPAPSDLDWDAWCGPTEPRGYHEDLFQPRSNPGWISFRPYSGGEMTGWGAHGLDQVQWALGMDASGPVEIWTEGEPFQAPVYSNPETRERGDKAGSQPTVFLRYATGAVLKLGEGPPGGAIFIGDKGRITIDRDKFTADPVDLAREPLGESAVRLPVSTNHLGNWIDCVKSRATPIADVEIGHRSATVCHLGNIARLLGRRLQWDAKAELFVGDEDANRLVDRDRRAPYQMPETV